MFRNAGQQHFVISREQLCEIGKPKQIEYRLKQGVLERCHRSTYRIAGSPNTWKQRLMAACFAGGKYSVASFRAAAELSELPAGEELCEVTSPRWRRTRHDDVIPHESFHLTDRDITYVDNIPVTRTKRTINDLGLLVEDGTLPPRVLELAMLEATRRNLVDTYEVWAEWERLGGSFRPGGAAVEAMLKGFIAPEGTAQTTPEIQLLQFVREAGLPEPVLQFRIWLSATRYVDVDLAWPEFKVFAEFDSYKWHGSSEAYESTINRRIEIESLDWRGVPVTTAELAAGAPKALTLLTKLLRR
jgi:hypothetical protein